MSERNDDVLQKKWSRPRVVYSETNPPPKGGLRFDVPLEEDSSADAVKQEAQSFRTGEKFFPLEKIKSLTDESAAHDSDVNVIVARFHKTGVLPGQDVEKVYADIADAPTYQDALGIVAAAQQQFQGLTAEIRKRFHNDPAEFLDFATDPQNAPEMIKLGLATPRVLSDNERIVAELRKANEALSTPRQPAEGGSPNSSAGKRKGDA